MDARTFSVLALSAALIIATGSAAIITGPSAPVDTQPTQNTTDSGPPSESPPTDEHDHSAIDIPREWATPFGTTASTSPPQEDTIGWEDGYWYNDSLEIDTADGLTEEELAAVTARSKARVERIRGIEFTNDVPVSVISRDTYQSEYAHTSNYSDSYRTFDNEKFEAMFLVGEDEDALRVQQATRGSSVSGFYDSNSDQIVLVSNSDTLEVSEKTLIHELVHAAQDQEYNLSTYSATTRNGYAGETGLIEGDANFVEQQFNRHCQSDWDCVTPSDQSNSPPGSDFHWGIYLLDFFPYSDGPGFIAHLGSNGGWDAVNDAYVEPPTTSAEIIHPETYPRSTPELAGPEDRSTTEWTRLDIADRPSYASLGEAAIFTMFGNTVYDTTREGAVLRQPLYEHGGNEDPFNYDYAVTDGYVDDRLYVYENASGNTGYTWTITFDDSNSAQEFVSGYTDLLDYYRAAPLFDGSSIYVIENGPYEDAFAVTQTGSAVTIVNAPSPGALVEIDTTVSAGGDTHSIAQAEP